MTGGNILMNWGKSVDQIRGKSLDFTRGKSLDLTRGKSLDLNRGKSIYLTRGIYRQGWEEMYFNTDYWRKSVDQIGGKYIECIVNVGGNMLIRLEGKC